MAESYIKDLKKTLPCAAYLDGEYGVKNLYAGVPVIIGKNGVERIIEINLSSKEKEKFNLSIKSVQKLYKVAKSIDKNLQLQLEVYTKPGLWKETPSFITSKLKQI